MYRSISIALLLAVTLAGLGCAAQQHFDRGQAALQANDPVQARHHFSRALEHDPKLADKPEFAEDYRLAQRDAAVVEGEQALRRNQPVKAIERFETALSHQSGWEPALDGRDRARSAAADLHHRQALNAADQGRLDQARIKLDEALRHVASHPAATEALASLTAATENQPADYRLGQQHARQKEWDNALAALRRSVTTRPNFLPARAAIPATLDAAATDMLRTGRDLLAQNKFDDAEVSIQRIADYRPQHAELPIALGEIDLGRGDANLDGGRPGLALLAYRAAHDHLRKHNTTLSRQADTGIQTATNNIRNQHHLAVKFAPSSAEHPQVSNVLARAVQRRLEKRGGLALAFGNDGQMIDLDVAQLTLPRYTIHTEAKIHTYEIEYEIPNPHIPVLKKELHHLDDCLDDFYAQEKKLEHRHRHLLQLHHKDPHHGHDQAAHKIYLKLDKLRDEIKHARRDRQAVAHKLHAEPSHLIKTRTEHWPYTRSTHERTATLVASYTIDSHYTDSPKTLTTQLTDRDTTNHPARPDLGLADDPLELLNDTQLQAELIEEAAKNFAHALGVALVQQRVDQLDLEIKSLRFQPSGNTLEFEPRVAKAVLWSAINPADGERMLAELQAELY